MEYQQTAATKTTEAGDSKVETIRQLAKRHMMDQFHSTTDEELKNAVVEVDLNPFPEFRPADDHKSDE